MQEMKKSGLVWKFEDNIDTDVILPGRFMAQTNLEDLGKYAFVNFMPNFVKEITSDDIIVAGENFGSGSSREHAPLALKYANTGAVIAKSFARIFYRNAINVGLPALTFVNPKDYDKISFKDKVELDIEKAKLKIMDKCLVIDLVPLPPSLLKILKVGDFIEYLSIELKNKEKK